MSDQLFVEPDELRAAGREAAAAGVALGRARDALAAAEGLTARDLDPRAHDKVATFVRQWCSEYQLIAQMLRACCAVLDEAADGYEALETGIVGALCSEGN